MRILGRLATIFPHQPLRGVLSLMERSNHTHLSGRLSHRERTEVRALSVFASALIVIFAFQLASCETGNYIPPVTPTMTGTGSRAKQGANSATLERGRM